METGRTIRQLIDAGALTDDDVLALHQLQVYNPITQQNGDTRSVSLRRVIDYFLNRTGLSDIGSQIDNLGQNLLTKSDFPFFAWSSPFLVASSHRRRLILKAGTKIGNTYIQQDIELNIDTLLDTGYLQNGKDYYIFASQNADPITFLVSLIKTPPQGFILFGGFHTLCVGVGSGLTYPEGGVMKDHKLNGYVAADILPDSIWCINFMAFGRQEGTAYIPTLDEWYQIYWQSGSGANSRSVYQGAITRSRQYVDHVEDMACIGMRLPDDAGYAAAMIGSNEQTAVAGANEAGATTGGAGGRVDTAGRRMVSIYGLEEGCGSLWCWLEPTAAAGRQGEISQQLTEDPISYGFATISSANYGPFPQAGGKGKFWGVAGALRAGGTWSSGAHCGSRARSALSARSLAASSYGGRGRSRCIRGNSLLSV